MKLSWKIYCFSFFIIMIITGVVGLILIDSIFNVVLDNAVAASLTKNEYALKSFETLLETNTSAGYEKNKKYFLHYFNNDNSSNISICTKEETFCYDGNSFVNLLENNEQGYSIVSDNNIVYLNTVSKINNSNTDYYIQTLEDITYIYIQRDTNIKVYRYILIITAVVSSVILLVFSLYITRPFKKLSDATNEISNGNFSKRITQDKLMMKSTETTALIKNFNTMAEYISDYTNQLEMSVKNRDDFIANFTHELKTPMTSIIGYADMLRSYNLNPGLRRESANSIYKEGKRLEDLSLKLLDLLVLKNSDFELIPVNTGHFFENVFTSVKFLAEKYNITINKKIEPAVILIEPTLMQTVIYNLIDNACKASNSGGVVNLGTKTVNGRYKIYVEDFGKGISKESFDKITEPFYMEDKSRSRAQGGAGLGLSIVNQILILHNTKLVIESVEKIGTVVSFYAEVSNEEI